MGKLKMSENRYLMHHGIQGQKWGIRLYQNKDGTLTPLGRLHYYGSTKTREQRMQERAERMDAKKKDLVARGSKSAIYKNRALFTDEEFDEAMKRADKFDKTRNEIRLSRRQQVDDMVDDARNLMDQSRQAKKEQILRTSNPMTIVKNASLFSDEELQQAVRRMQNISQLKSMTPQQKIQAAQAQALMRDKKPVVDELISGMKKANTLVDTANDLVIDTYQSSNKIKSIINAINGNDDLKTYALEPWDALKPKTKKLKKNDFNDLLDDYHITGLSREEKDALYERLYV